MGMNAADLRGLQQQNRKTITMLRARAQNSDAEAAELDGVNAALAASARERARLSLEEVSTLEASNGAIDEQLASLENPEAEAAPPTAGKRRRS